jgi:ABC-type glycerol-3-phosphate transport system substrate-binding protein
MAEDPLEKANALMRRRRVFVAGAPEQKSLLGEDESDGLPVLMDIVDATAAAEADPQYARLAAQREALADALATWLDTELPSIVTAVVDGLTDQIVAQVTAEARAALLPRLQEALEAEPPQAPAAE